MGGKQGWAEALAGPFVAPRGGQRGGMFQPTMRSKVTPWQLAVLMTIAENDGLSQIGVVERRRTASTLATRCFAFART